MLNDLVLGEGTPYHLSEVDWGGIDTESQEFTRPLKDGVVFGRDIHRPKTITFDGIVFSNDVPGDLEVLTAAWMNDKTRMRPGALNRLYYCKFGRQRFVYGRPQRFLPIYKGRQAHHAEFLCDFRRATAYTYDAEEQHNFGNDGEAIYPNVKGTVMPRMKMRITGPMVDPIVSVANWQIAFKHTLASETAFIEINSYPGQEYIIDQNGMNMAGKLTALSPYMSNMVLPLGLNRVMVTDSTSKNEGRVDVWWHDTYSGI